MKDLIKIITHRIKMLCSLREPPYELPADSFIDKASEDIINAIFDTWHWISIKDGLPKHNQFFLGVSKSGNMVVLRCDLHIYNEPIDYVFMNPELTHQVRDITHWMPLPRTPEKAG
jgi:hypothetical protein